MDNPNADLKVFISEVHAEPDERNCEKMIDRKTRFKFIAKKNARYFNEDAACYLSVYSYIGCTIKIKPSSAKIRALAEPEKVKEFNRQMTKSEIAAIENAAKKHEQYVQSLEEKYEGKSMPVLPLPANEHRSSTNFGRLTCPMCLP